MHKYKNMTSEIYVLHEFHVARTQQPEQLSSLMRLSSEKWKKKKKKISLSLLERQYLSEGSVAWGADWWFVVKKGNSQFSFCSRLPRIHPSSLLLCVLSIFISQGWNVYMVHYTLETIRDSLRMNEEDHLNRLLRGWSVTDHPVLRLGMENSDYFRKRV